MKAAARKPLFSPSADHAARQRDQIAALAVRASLSLRSLGQRRLDPRQRPRGAIAIVTIGPKNTGSRPQRTLHDGLPGHGRRIRDPPVNRIRRRAGMSACPTCERPSPRQRSNPSLEGIAACLTARRQLQRRPHRQNRRRVLPLRRKSRAAAHVVVGDKTSWKYSWSPPQYLEKHNAPRGAVTGITARKQKGRQGRRRLLTIRSGTIDAIAARLLGYLHIN
jgi:hypothetical protein